MRKIGLCLIWALAMALPGAACRSPQDTQKDGGVDGQDAATEPLDAGGQTPDASIDEPSGTWIPPSPVDVPPLPPSPDYSGRPVDSQGRAIIAQGSGIDLVVPAVPNAISARERCADLVTNCFEPGTRSLDACMLSAPRCATAQPWTESGACCAEACWTAYTGLRAAGVDPLTATLEVLYSSPNCMPGVDAMAGGAQ